ncbi:MAG: phosphoribosylformylglycinamidine cyclo-ligase [Candidatus Neomarinimicrobiota bacterium]|nr:phosphoribosylformylglycinamidine cyclo-ligase [Candidatus Neomarinimicrobiota bacterium]RKY48335.1 MAG: phosphoribosylformylglycinamidine cyclo-ligase [Candidatus Neomarinimicrobiota bacterium]
MKTYREAGVNIDEGNRAVDRIKDIVKTTFNKNVVTGIGLFGGLFKFEKEKYKEPVLVSSTDGVGTKVMIAASVGKFDTIGQCLVNHCVNDILTCGARPLFFLDYIGIGKLLPEYIEEIVSGLAIACRQNGCVLIGGEMAEMPDVYGREKFDLVGTIVGVVEREKLLYGKVREGDVLIGLRSSGLHTNGYTLARKVLLEKFALEEYIDELGCVLGEELLRVHRSYLGPVSGLLERGLVRGMSHITGGGIVGNTRRILPEGLRIEVDWDAWEWPPIFKLIRDAGNVPEDEMRRVFNLGIGFVIICDKNDIDEVFECLQGESEDPVLIGSVVREDR